jgi:hypothetical protein
MKQKLNALALQVHGQNEVNRILYETASDLLPQLEQYIGKKIFTQTGKSAKFSCTFKEVKINPFQSGNKGGDFTLITDRQLIEKSDGLILVIGICLNGGLYEDKTYYCQYFENTVYLGQVKENILQNLNGRSLLTPLKKVINLKDQERKILQYKNMASKLKELNLKIVVPDHFYKDR